MPTNDGCRCLNISPRTGQIVSHNMSRVVITVNMAICVLFCYFLPLNMKGYICHFTKWQIHPLISTGTIYVSLSFTRRSLTLSSDNIYFSSFRSVSASFDDDVALIRRKYHNIFLHLFVLCHAKPKNAVVIYIKSNQLPFALADHAVICRAKQNRQYCVSYRYDIGRMIV